MTRDYHREVRDLAARLEVEGLTADARALVDAVEAGSTGSEILMALRYHLERIAESGVVRDAETHRRVVELGQAIGAALGRTRG